MYRNRCHRGMVCSLLSCMLLLPVGTAFAAESEPTVHVGGDVAKPGDWNVAQIRKELASEVKPVQYAARGEQHQSDCVPLVALLKAAGVQTELKMGPSALDPKTKHQELRLIVVVQGSDGYAVSFSLAELMTDVGDRTVWLALDSDGKPLPVPGEGPMKLMVPDDKKPARAVHSIQTISIINPTPPATQPAN